MFHLLKNRRHEEELVAAHAQTQALARMVHILLQTLANHPIRGEQIEYDRFYAALLGIETGLGGTADATQILLLSGAASKAVEEYNHHTARFLAFQRGQLASLLADAAVILPGGPSPQTAKLRETAHAVNATQSDISPQLGALAQCISAIRESPKEPTAAPAPIPPRPHKSTSSRIAAEAALAGAHRIGSCFAAAIAIDRIPLIAARWGQPTADTVMQAYTAELHQSLAHADHVFRWSDGSLLLLLCRPVPLAVVRGELDRALPHRFERTFEAAGRSIMLTVDASSKVWRLDPAEPLEMALHRIESFFDLHLAAGAEA